MQRTDPSGVDCARPNASRRIDERKSRLGKKETRERGSEEERRRGGWEREKTRAPTAKISGWSEGVRL